MKRSSLLVSMVLLLVGTQLLACVPVTAPPATTGAAVAATPAAPTALPAATVVVAAPTAAPTGSGALLAGELSLAALKNAEYSSEVVSGGKVTLRDGSYEGPSAPGAASKVSVRLLEQWVASGDLNADGAPDAAVILVESGGGTGSFYRLIAVLNAGGRLNPAAAAVLGDRVKINAVSIQAGEIVVDLITHGPKDPACCPTLVARQTYRLQGGRLVQTNPVATSVATAASATAAPASSAGTTFSDPFAYCTAVGTVDAPDARYSGPKVPPAVAAGLMKAMNMPAGTPPPPIAQNSFWRCLDGKVYACTVGANLPCGEKANTDRTPTQAMKDYCQANPSSDFIPMVVTGRATVYAWQCKGGVAVVKEQTTAVDARGFLANIWYEVKP